MGVKKSSIVNAVNEVLEEHASDSLTSDQISELAILVGDKMADTHEGVYDDSDEPDLDEEDE